jgi:hypothetical protein
MKSPKARAVFLYICCELFPVYFLLTRIFLNIPELAFTELILYILYWIYEIAIHSPIFILDFPTNLQNCKIYIIYFWWEIGLFLVYLTVEENAGVP